MITEYSSKQYKITYQGIAMIENALDNPNLVQISVVSGCTVTVAPQPEYGIELMPNKECPSWKLTGINTKLNRKEAHFIYARLVRGTDQALIVFSVRDYAVDGSVAGGEPSETYYYIKIGEITATDSAGNDATLDREISLDYGILGSYGDQVDNSASWKELFEVTAEGLIRPLKKFTSFIVQGTLSIIGKIVLNEKQVSDITRQGDQEEEFEESDEALPTTALLMGKYLTKLRGIFLNKDREDSTDFVQTFKKGVKMGEYTTGLLGTGGAVLVDENGNSHAEFDYLNIRKKALFTEITVQELKHIGGALIISPAAMVISEVEETAQGYKCYFEKKDSDGRTIYNEFVSGDQGRCQTFNLEKQENGQVGNRYWWRLVVATGDDYVVFSKTDADTGSDIPQAGDQVAQLGNRTDVTRQNAQIYSAYGSDSPSRKMYQGINSYVLVGKVIKDEYFDVVSGRFKEVTYGDVYIGNRENTSYVKFDQDTGVGVAGKVEMQAGSSGASNLEDLPDEVYKAVQIGGENLLLNTGFMGDYTPVALNSSTRLTAASDLYGPRLEGWGGSGTVIEDEQSASGFACMMGPIFQKVELIEGETYTVSYRAKGTSVNVSLGGASVQQPVTSTYARYTHKFVFDGGDTFQMDGNAVVCEIKLERGTIATDWCPSVHDNPEITDRFKGMWSIQAALKGDTQFYGGLGLTTMMMLGKWVDGVMEQVNAGISGVYNEDTDVAMWAGGNYEQAIATVNKLVTGEQPTDEEWKSLAKFVVTHGGNVFIRGYIYALGGVFRGTIYARDGEFNGMVKIADGKILLNKDGSGSLANGELTWDKDGNLSLSSDFEITADGYTLKLDKNFAEFRIYDSKGRMIVGIQPYMDMAGSSPVVRLALPDADRSVLVGVDTVTFTSGENNATYALDRVQFGESGEVFKGMTGKVDLRELNALYFKNGILYDAKREV